MLAHCGTQCTGRVGRHPSTCLERHAPPRPIYVPGKPIVHGNATATAHNIAASETLFRLGIAADLIGQALEGPAYSMAPA